MNRNQDAKYTPEECEILFHSMRALIECTDELERLGIKDMSPDELKRRVPTDRMGEFRKIMIEFEKRCVG